MDKPNWERREGNDSLALSMQEIASSIKELKRRQKEEAEHWESPISYEIRDLLANYEAMENFLKDLMKGSDKQINAVHLADSLNQLKPRFDAVINNEVH